MTITSVWSWNTVRFVRLLQEHEDDSIGRSLSFPKYPDFSPGIWKKYRKSRKYEKNTSKIEKSKNEKNNDANITFEIEKMICCQIGGRWSYPRYNHPNKFIMLLSPWIERYHRIAKKLCKIKFYLFAQNRK